MRTIVFWGSILGSPCFGKLPYGLLQWSARNLNDWKTKKLGGSQ